MKLFDNPWPYLYFKYVIFHQVSSTGSHIVSPLLLLSWKQHLLKVHLGITENWRTAFVFGTQMSQIFRQSDFTFDGRTEADICCWLRYITTTRARVRYTLLGILLHIWVICLEVLGWPDFSKKEKKKNRFQKVNKNSKFQSKDVMVIDWKMKKCTP